VKKVWKYFPVLGSKNHGFGSKSSKTPVLGLKTTVSENS